MNLSYETARKLKDAGFPQDGNGTVRLQGSAFSGGIYHCYIPTLSELIEECGEGFSSLNKVPNGTESWQAFFADGRFTGWYSTPKEAVAALYLTLKKV